MVGSTLCVLVGGTNNQVSNYVNKCEKAGNIVFTNDPMKLSKHLLNGKYVITTEKAYNRNKSVKNIGSESVCILFNKMNLGPLNKEFDRVRCLIGKGA